MTFSNIVAVPRARTFAFAVFFVALLTTVPASAATRHVARIGVDVGDCALAPCASFEYAYGRAAAGDVIQVAAGSYGRQSTPQGSKAVTFRGGPGVVLRQMVNDASNVTFDGINVDAGGVTPDGAAFELGGDRVTVKNAVIGNVVDEKVMLASGQHQTVDNVTFHDAIYKTDGTHMECLYAIGVEGFTLRNSFFRDCAVFDVFFTFGTWWSPPPPAYGRITIENNVFSHPEMENNRGWHYYSVYVADTGPHGEGGDPMNGWIVRNNSFESPVFISSSGGAGGTVWAGNLGGWDCKGGINYRYNVGDKCGPTDKQVSPSSSSSDRTAAFSWVDPARGDFRLRAGSPAINTGTPQAAPAVDKLGLARDSRPDAGAFEFGAKAPGGGGAGVGALRIVRAKLKPKVICKRPRRGCPRATRLRVGLSLGARVSVRIKRLRAGHRPRRVRSFGFVAAPRSAHKIKARRLKKGRYRVVVRASGAGQRTPARSLRLRVR